MKAFEHERRDWVILAIILLIGLLSVLLAGGWAIRLSPSWQLVANMGSNLDLNSDFLTRRPDQFIEPLDPSILTLPVWINVFLTPGASFSTRIPAATGTPDVFIPPTKAVPATQTVSPTSTFVYFIPAETSTSKPVFTRTSAPEKTSTSIPTSTPTSTATPTFTPTAMNTPVITDIIPPQIGNNPDGSIYGLPAGSALTLSINLIADGDAGPDLVYYELPAGSGILLDWVIVEIGDGNNWYTVFNWYDDIADTNSNMNFNKLSIPLSPPPEEIDQRDILATDLYTSLSGYSTGIAIDIDMGGSIPPGTYPYIRFYAPTGAGEVDGYMEIDAIEVLP